MTIISWQCRGHVILFSTHSRKKHLWNMYALSLHFSRKYITQKKHRHKSFPRNLISCQNLSLFFQNENWYQIINILPLIHKKQSWQLIFLKHYNEIGKGQICRNTPVNTIQMLWMYSSSVIMSLTFFSPPINIRTKPPKDYWICMHSNNIGFACITEF